MKPSRVEKEMMENSYNTKFVAININNHQIIIRYKFETTDDPGLLKFIINMVDLANLLVVLRQPTLAQIELELEMDIKEGENIKTVSLPIPENVLLATPSELIRFELESNIMW